MKPSDRGQFAELLTDALAFYRRDVSEFALNVWWSACQPFDFEQVGKALTAHAMDPERGQFAPMPADIVKQLQGTYTDRSLVAWGKVLDAIRRAGMYQSVVFDDPAIHAAVEDLGGWPGVCAISMEELPHTQRRFMDSHRTYSKRPDLAYPPKLIGVHERENGLANRRVAPPLLIGDVEAAKRVMAGGSESGRMPISVLDALPKVKQIGRAA